MSDSPAYAAFQSALAPHGLNLFGVLDGATYDAHCPPAFRRANLLPAARSAIVVGSGGRAMWDAIAAAPEAGIRHRINTFTQRVIQEATTPLRDDARAAVCLWPNAIRQDAFIPLMRLAIAAGIGVPSKLALLINPTYGLWIGLRAVVLTERELDPTPPLAETAWDPCRACHAPCAGVCHGRVFGAAGYDGQACLATRVTTRTCRRTCDARLACPVGVEHHYGTAQLAHHARHLLNPLTLGRYALFALRQTLPGGGSRA